MKTTIQITSNPIQASLPSFPLDGKSGALSEFWGIVRGEEKGSSISGITYEAYASMAQKKIHEILINLSEAYPCQEVTIIHRVGLVPVGEPSLWIRAQGKHRHETIHLIDQFIIRLKEEVPIWKTF